MTETKTNDCEYCGKEDAKPQHVRMCKMNPNRPSNKKPAMTPEPEQNTPCVTQDEPVLLVMSDIHPYTSDRSAMFKVDDVVTYMSLEAIGLYHTPHDGNIPCVLVMTDNGMLTPPFLMSGFVGVVIHNEEEPIPYGFICDEPFPPFEVREDNDDVENTHLTEKLNKSKLNKAIVSDESKQLLEDCIDVTGC